jgi:N6-adenosine-specific RNA methylase IME4
MGRPPILRKAMIEAERSRRYRRNKKIRDDPKRARREARERELGKRILALPDKRYGVTLIDPPWRFKTYSRDTGMDRAADNHYPTMTVEEIMALDVPSLMAPDAAMFLWTTVPFAAIAHRLIDHWDFEYKSQATWVKDDIAHGYWFRNRHELLLVATRGKVPAPAMGDQFDSVIEAAAREHSVKPDRVYEIIESYFPTLPKIELFARRARPGWDVWGAEAPVKRERLTMLRRSGDPSQPIYSMRSAV